MDKAIHKSIAISIIPVFLATAILSVFAAISTTSASGGTHATFVVDKDEALPGDIINFVYELKNDTDDPVLVNFLRKVTENADGIEYMNGSGFMQWLDAETYEPIKGKNSNQPVQISIGDDFHYVFSDDHRMPENSVIRITWQERITGNVLGDTSQVAVAADIKDIDGNELPFVLRERNIFIVDESVVEKRFDVVKSANRKTVVPNGVIEYTIKVENTGNVQLSDLQMQLDLPNGRERWVEYVPGTGIASITNDEPYEIDDSWGMDPSNEIFNVSHMKKGDLLVVTYAVRVDPETPVGTTLNSVVRVRSEGSTIWENYAAETKVVASADDHTSADTGTDSEQEHTVRQPANFCDENPEHINCPGLPIATGKGGETPSSTTSKGGGTIPTPISQLPNTGIGAASIALWLMAATGLTVMSFKSGRKIALR